MKRLEQVKRDLFLVLSICAVLINCQDSLVQNGTKIVGLHDPGVDATVKSALENGTVSEVVVRKDLLLFPINAPNLVIAHRQEIHAVPQNNGTENTDGKPTAAEVAEVNEYSLSQVISNDTDDNGTETPASPAAAPSPVRGPENAAVLEPGQLLEVPSGFDLPSGLATEKVALPDALPNVSLPKQSIVDLLSKSLAQSSLTTLPTRGLSKRSAENATTPATLVDYSAMVKRSVKPQDEEDDSHSDESTGSVSSTENVNDSLLDADHSDEDSSQMSSTTEIGKRSAESDGDSGSSTTDSNSKEMSESSIAKRSIDLDDDDDDDSASTTEFYDHEVAKPISSSSIDQNQRFTYNDNKKDDVLSETGDKKQYLRERETEEDMDVAEDIVFRPLFRYRQETRLRQQYSPYRRAGGRYYGNSDGDRYRYQSDNSDYD